jgi:hypothetical protein
MKTAYAVSDVPILPDTRNLRDRWRGSYNARLDIASWHEMLQRALYSSPTTRTTAITVQIETAGNEKPRPIRPGLLSYRVHNRTNARALGD